MYYLENRTGGLIKVIKIILGNKETVNKPRSPEPAYAEASAGDTRNSSPHQTHMPAQIFPLPAIARGDNLPNVNFFFASLSLERTIPTF